MSTVNYNQMVGLFCIVIGTGIIIFALGELLIRIIIAILALSLINYGLRLWGWPPLQLLIPTMLHRARFNKWR